MGGKIFILIMVTRIIKEEQVAVYGELIRKLADILQYTKDNNIVGLTGNIDGCLMDVADAIYTFKSGEVKDQEDYTYLKEIVPKPEDVYHLDPNKVNVLHLKTDGRYHQDAIILRDDILSRCKSANFSDRLLIVEDHSGRAKLKFSEMPENIVEINLE